MLRELLFLRINLLVFKKKTFGEMISLSVVVCSFID